MHKPEYKKYLLEPHQILAGDLSEEMLFIDLLFIVGPKNVSRISKDVRFSGNKNHYKTTMWLTFRRPTRDWVDAPAYFFEIAATSYCYVFSNKLFYSLLSGFNILAPLYHYLLKLKA